MKQIYLDHAAATPLDDLVFKRMLPFLKEQFYNPSATYLSAQKAAGSREAARRRVAHWFGARPAEIIFTAGGTEANNLAIHGVMRQFPDKKILVSSMEHEAVLAPAHQYNYAEMPVASDGLVNLDALEAHIDEHTVMVSVMYANNEIGTIQPVRKVAQLVAAERKKRTAAGSSLPIYLHTDACQAAGYLDLHAARLGADMITINAGKIYGPKQSGALFIRTGVHLEPSILGGGQENGLRSGTENLAHIVGLATALDIAQEHRHEESGRLESLRDEFIAQLIKEIPSVVVNGSLRHRLPNNIHVTIPGHDNERLLMALDEQGIMAAAGSACSASSEQASHVLKAIGKSDADAYASLRFTLGRQTSSDDLQYTVKVLGDILQQ